MIQPSRHCAIVAHVLAANSADAGSRNLELRHRCERDGIVRWLTFSVHLTINKERELAPTKEAARFDRTSSANDRFDPLVTVGVTALAWPAENAARAPVKEPRARTAPPRHGLGCCIRGLFCLFFGFGNRFFVLLSVLLNLSPGLIGRDILRLGQSISSFIRCGGLLSGSPESAARTAVAAASRSAAGSWPPEALRNRILDGSHWIASYCSRKALRSGPQFERTHRRLCRLLQALTMPCSGRRQSGRGSRREQVHDGEGRNPHAIKP